MPRLRLPRNLPALLLLAVVFALAGLPVLSMLLGALRSGPGGSFGTTALARVFLTTAYLKPLMATLEIAFHVALLGTLFGVALAWIMSRIRPPGRGLLEVGIMLPIFISPFVGAIGWITLGQPNTGMINVALRALGLPTINILSYGGAMFIMALFLVPYGYTLIRHSLDRLNPELEEAAAVCGAHTRGTILGVIVPMLWPSLLSAFVILFVLSAEMFSIPGLLLVPHGYSNLSYAIYAKTTHWPINQAEASAIGIVLLVMTLIGMAIYAYAVRVQERFISIGPKSPRAVMRSGPWSLPALIGCLIVLIYVIISSVLPVLALTLRALLPYFSGDFALSDLSLVNLRHTMADQLAITALGNSIIVTAGSTVLLMMIAFLVALGRVRKPSALSLVTWLVASIPIAVPGVLIGLGMIWLYIRTPIYATLAIIFLVMLARFLPILVRMFETGLIQVGRELDQAAAICGASDLTITLQIRIPLLAGTMRSAAAVVGTQIFNELTASALVFTSTSSVLPVVIFNYMFDGNYSQASALALVQIVILMAGLAFLWLAGTALPAMRSRMQTGRA